ncbi:MAG TPA: nucleoside transporter C-terminal domain-containing protein [Thermodesulfobacteriota bacterium]|nr:nucleoside transporter C-terminal domain-containing protein [Thermodesulfobacteriota bacterium]
MNIYNLVSFVGIFVLMGIAWLISSDKRNINCRVIIWGVVLQLIFGAFIFIVPAGAKVFLYINDLVVTVLDSASAGARFLFGRLALPPGTKNEFGETSLGFFLAFQAFPTIIFFSALMSILYFLNIMQKVIRGFSYAFTRLMRVSGAESLCAASNIFVGVESALTVKPYLHEMTRSELCTVLTAGMATVSSNVLAIYVFSLQNQFPTIAGHLVSASVLSAPAALIMSKILVPEREMPKTLGVDVVPYYEKESSFFEAIINGAESGVKLIVGIVALLIAVLGLVALTDLIVGGIGGKINPLFNVHIDCSLKGISGYIFYPFTLIIGIPLSDTFTISKIIGERAIVTEVVSYQDLALAIGQGLLEHERSVVVATYALCGFAHLASMAIFVGGISALAPDRKKALAKVGFRALIAATFACLMTACIAGTFFTEGSILLRK